MKEDIKMYDKLPIKEIPMLFKLPETALGYTSLPFFKN